MRRARREWASEEVREWLFSSYRLNREQLGARRVQVTFGTEKVYILWEGRKYWDVEPYPASEVLPCELCRVVMRKCKLTYASMWVPVRETWLDRYRFDGDLCFACVGRVTAWSRLARLYCEIASLIRKLDTARLHAAKA